VTSGLCFGEQVKKALGNYPNGWYFGDYGINYFMYDKALATSRQLAVYIAAVDKYNKTIDYTGFAGPSFGTVLTATKLYIQAGGASATSAKLATLVQKFAGPQWGISGPMTCVTSARCSSRQSAASTSASRSSRAAMWAPVPGAYNNKLINAFS